jgi:hypothetical protein
MEDWLEELVKAFLGSVLEVIGALLSSMCEGSEWLLSHLLRGILHLFKGMLESIAAPPLHPTDPTSKSLPDEQIPRKQSKKRRHSHRKRYHPQ